MCNMNWLSQFERNFGQNSQCEWVKSSFKSFELILVPFNVIYQIQIYLYKSFQSYAVGMTVFKF